MNVSVVIPTYNRKAAVARAVRSVLAQSVAPSEIIVVDDGSEDGTSDALAGEFGSSIFVLRTERHGVAAARNAGVAASSAPLVAFLDSDDEWLPHKLETQLPVFADDSGAGERAVVVCAGNWRRRGAADDEFSRLGLTGRPCRIDAPLAELLREGGHAIWLSTWIVRRDAFDAAGGFDPRFRVAEDTDFLFRLARHGAFHVVPELVAERSADVDHYQLTNLADPQYLREIASYTTDILSRVERDVKSRHPDLASRYDRLFSYYLRRVMEYAAIDGDSPLARRYAREILSRSAGRVEKLSAVAAFLSPRIVGARRRRSLARLSPDTRGFSHAT
ncbi:MAG: glycosyltransferase family 2 protein [Spirochaetaceae bacterium]|nr:MAG: glycosyltransferase family 2 protein [Spirochaetaceae bacterium]